MNKTTPIQHQGLSSRPGVTPFGKVDTDRRAGRRVLGRLLQSSEYHEQKKLALSCPSAKLALANLRVIIDFPARSFSQKTRCSCLHVNYRSISWRTPTLVPPRYPCSRRSTRHPWCDTSRTLRREAVLVPVHRSAHMVKRLGARLTMSS